jgi:protein-tyrosine phosphatase
MTSLSFYVSQIYPDLAVGSYLSLSEMKINGWDCLCLSSVGKNLSCDLKVLKDGGSNTIEELKDAITWVVDAWKNNKKVFVCCRHGINRSVAIAAAAMVISGRHENYSSALFTIYKKRAIAAPLNRMMFEVLDVILRMEHEKC